jgi:hypothetical protein
MKKLFGLFFAFGASMCLLTILLLLFPGTSLDSLWRFNPEGHSAFQSLGKISVLLLLVVGTGCAFAGTGMWQGTLWGARLALIILSVNIIGDLLNALIRHDRRTLTGIPIAGAMIVYLVRSRTKSQRHGLQA